MSNRRATTKKLTNASIWYWIKKRYSCYKEISVTRRGRLRADILCLNMKQELIITEIKSCWQDFSSDNKWHKYPEYCHKMYFCITEELWESKEKELKDCLKPHGIGLLVWAGPTSRHVPTVKIKAKRRQVDPSSLNYMLTKMSWRGGIFKPKARRKRN